MRLRGDSWNYITAEFIAPWWDGSLDFIPSTGIIWSHYAWNRGKNVEKKATKMDGRSPEKKKTKQGINQHMYLYTLNIYIYCIYVYIYNIYIYTSYVYIHHIYMHHILYICVHAYIRALSYLILSYLILSYLILHYITLHYIHTRDSLIPLQASPRSGVRCSVRALTFIPPY